MSIPETRIGGTQEDFPETAWSSILSSPDSRSSQRRDRLNRLLTRYWRPVYAFIRTSWGRSIEDAKDLAQEFFCSLLESDFVLTYRPDKGRFRNYLKAALQNFLSKDRRDSGRIKRGGGRTVLSLDAEGLETEEFLADARRLPPEQMFDRQWAHDVMSRALEELRRSLCAEGKERVFRIYEAFELSGERPSYDAISQTFSISFHDVKNALNFARARLRELLMSIVSDTVATAEDLRDEMNRLFHG